MKWQWNFCCLVVVLYCKVPSTLRIVQTVVILLRSSASYGSCVMTYTRVTGETRFRFSNNNGSLGSNWNADVVNVLCIPLVSCIYRVVYRCVCVFVDESVSQVMYCVLSVALYMRASAANDCLFLSSDGEVLYVNVESFRVLRSCLVTSSCDSRACIECTCTIWQAVAARSELCSGYITTTVYRIVQALERADFGQ